MNLIKFLLILVVFVLIQGCVSTNSNYNTTRILNDKGQVIGYETPTKVMDTKGRVLFYKR
jgi:hypothetical protein